MKKSKSILFVALLGTALVTTSCGGSNPVTPPVVEEEYAITVTAPSTVTYSLNKTQAKKGEEVILTIDSLADGFSIKSVKVNSGNDLTPEADGKTYKFTMPNRPANIAIKVSVEGDVVINGDFAVAFTKTADDVYEAKNVFVESEDKEYLNFNIMVNDTKLGVLELDETNSYGDFGMANSASYVFKIATGCYYDFKYDLNKEIPLTIKRVAVNENYLPDSKNSLASILLDGYAVRSEPAMYIDDLVSATFEIRDTTTQDVFNHKFEWKKYLNNTTYATVKDLMYEENPDMVVYRHYDEENKTYSVVDSYALKVGEITVNDDRFREYYNSYGAYSARYDVIEGDDYGYRFAKSVANVSKELRSTSHNPAYLLERSIMYSYRVGFEEDDEVKSNKVDISSTKTATGFQTVIDSYKEYDSTAGTYTTDHHEAYVYAVTIDFDNRGAVTNLVYKKTVYTQDQWDFVNHQPKQHVTGIVRESIKAKYTYGQVTETCDFDPSPYFITSIDEYQYVSPELKDKATTSDSYLGLSDDLYISDGGEVPSCVKVSYTPSTALDLWQYGPTHSSNEDVVAKTPYDLYYSMSAINEGTAVVTFTNHVSTPSIQGAVKDVTVHVMAKRDVRSFYIYRNPGDDPSYSEVDTAESAIVHANGQYKFRIGASPSGSPLVYTAVSGNTSYLKIVSASNSSDLVIDTTGAKNITSNVTVKVTINSSRYEEGRSPTVFSFYITPAQANPVGTWEMDLSEGNTMLYFTEEAYTPEPGYFKGYISDHYIDKDGVDHGTDIFYFYYKYNGAYITCDVYDAHIETVSYEVNVDDLYLDFYYDGKTGKYGVFLADTEYDDYYEDTVYYPIIGEVDEYGLNITAYYAFTKVS